MDIRKSEAVLEFIRSLYPNETPVPLHAPRFLGNEKKYLAECVDTTYVSYVGKFVTDFEEHIKRVTGARHAIAMVNGTAALHMVLVAAGVQPDDLVITQALTFAATAAGIKHAGAEPAFVDVDRDTLGMSPDSLLSFLFEHAERKANVLIDKATGRRIAAVVPMHTFGHPARIDRITTICGEYGVQLIEDAAESLGSMYKGTHTGLFGRGAILSFNGNKPVTTGGGGMVITNDDALAERARYISTTAKRKNRWEFFHDEVGYNLRLPNVNAAIGCAQMEYFDRIIDNKRETAAKYKRFFDSEGMSFFTEPDGARSNYWLNVIVLENRAEREAFLEYSNDNGVQTRPIWTLMNKLPPYAGCLRTVLPNAEWLEDRVVNIPSSVRV
ncbi:MAG: LegC family aminotransferase [Chlorobium sp.]|nr:LegC family aminotransferase [Chlorobium sp.]